MVRLKVKLAIPLQWFIILGMGFANIVTTAASVIPQLFSYSAQRQESKNLRRAADEQERLAYQQSESMVNTAVRNQIRGNRNANDKMAAAHMDAVASNLADSGTVRVRERDLATRLQDEINANANTTLQQANATLQQGLINAWNTRNLAKQAKAGSVVTGISAIGSLIGGIAGGLGGSGEKTQSQDDE